MNHSTSNDSKIGPEDCPSKPISTLADLQLKAYENRAREHLMAKYPTRTPAEACRLEKQIQKLVHIYAEGHFSSHRATLLRADGKDILSVRMHFNSERQAEEDVHAMAPED